MPTITPAPRLPYMPGAPYKYRRADIAPAQEIDDVAAEAEAGADNAFDEGDLPSFVPLPFKGQLIDKWI